MPFDASHFSTRHTSHGNGGLAEVRPLDFLQGNGGGQIDQPRDGESQQVQGQDSLLVGAVFGVRRGGVFAAGTQGTAQEQDQTGHVGSGEQGQLPPREPVEFGAQQGEVGPDPEAQPGAGQQEQGRREAPFPGRPVRHDMLSPGREQSCG
jgi:hypothetical protein